MMLIAHRGAAAYRPENTLASFRAAVELGAAAVEFDVQQTKDGELVVIHDTDLRRLAGSRRSVGEQTWRELSRIDVGSWFSTAFSGERVPSLKQVLEVVGGLPEVHLEIKQPRRPYAGIEERVLKACDGRDNVIFSSFHFATLERLRALAPKARIGWLAGRAYCRAEIKKAVRLGAESVHIDSRRARAGWVRAAREQGLATRVYTVNTRSAARRLEEIGVQGIFSDYPDLLFSKREAVAA